MITGYDRVIVARTPVGAGIRAMMDGLHGRWPGMLVAFGEVGTMAVGPALPWRDVRGQVPGEAGELYVSRDEAMELAWESSGYSLLDDGEGPFAVMYRPSPQPMIAIRVDEQPYERDGFGFEPHAATLVTAGLSLVTLVTPDEDSPFSRNLHRSLCQALAEQDGR